jgi:hypothetical protein
MSVPAIKAVDQLSGSGAISPAGVVPMFTDKLSLGKVRTPGNGT